MHDAETGARLVTVCFQQRPSFFVMQQAMALDFAQTTFPLQLISRARPSLFHLGSTDMLSSELKD